MEALMHYCRNWGDENCHFEIADIKYPNQIKGGDKIPRWPSNYKEYDKICKECKTRFFTITVDDLKEEILCPVCGKNDFIKTMGFEIFNSKEKKGENVYLKCKNCSTHTVLIKK